MPLVSVVEPSVPPSNGDMWLSDTCSMNDVPYFLKYHHSKICEQTTALDETTHNRPMMKQDKSMKQPTVDL